ncbi:MAG: hypothetical protein O3C22_06005 [Bacteroidetes bacterium]|nr:hypothetical protein [Bacteroidota bacterium]MDA0943855.1 hypothetical protein [Bacteroidota bacterium]MDA1112366.1 hypothetical protein [Bacteroidota bacterium]
MKNKHYKFLGSLFIVGAFVLLAYGSDDDSKSKESGTSNSQSMSSSESGVGSIEGSKNCLIGYDWVYPNGSNPTGAWKFSSDGTFNSSTTMFGGMSTWGNWQVTSPGKVTITYTRTSEGTIPQGQTLTMSSCNSLKVGSTTYIKD